MLEILRMASWMKEIRPDMLPEPYRKLSEIIGMDATLKLANEYQGTTIYFAKLDTTIKMLRDKKLRQEYNGQNIKDLAVRYGLTEVWVRQILSENLTQSNQGSLFEGVI